MAMLMTWRAPVFPPPSGGPRGGAHPAPRPRPGGGLDPPPRRYATEIALLIGPERDVPAPDMGTTPQIMAWIMDTLSMHAGHSVPASVTGKPIDIGGSEGRDDSPGRGLTFLTLEALKYLHLQEETPTLPIH